MMNGLESQAEEFITIAKANMKSLWSFEQMKTISTVL